MACGVAQSEAFALRPCADAARTSLSVQKVGAWPCPLVASLERSIVVPAFTYLVASSHLRTSNANLF